MPSERTYGVEVLPPDHTVTTDPMTGVALTFLTTNTRSSSIYFHERSWLADSSMIIFRGHRGLMGYLTETGELVLLDTPDGEVSAPTAATTRNSIFCTRDSADTQDGCDVLELTPEIRISPDPAAKPSTVTIRERHIVTLPAAGAINGNYDDTYLCARLPGPPPTANTIRVSDGELREVCRADGPNPRLSHLQWSRTASNMLCTAIGPDWHTEGTPPRLHIIDPEEGIPRPVYHQVVDELFTHESWWVDDQILYCGAPPAVGLPGDEMDNRQMAHVNVLNTKTGIVRIMGAGNWWSGEESKEVWRRNWWHCAGSDDGRWVVADTFHGDLALFEGMTTRPALLTAGHRVKTGTSEYAPNGAHPEPGWDRKGEQIIFSSHLLSGGESSDPNVCVATIPAEWQQRNPTPRVR
jgi:hypothetical protein